MKLLALFFSGAALFATYLAWFEAIRLGSVPLFAVGLVALAVGLALDRKFLADWKWFGKKGRDGTWFK